MALIQTEKITKIYKLGEFELKAINNITITIEEGEFVSIMGPSGSGKTTFMNIIGCLDKPTKGKYFLNGIDIEKLNRDELARLRNKKIGFVFQNFNLLPRTTALENVELPMLYNGTSAKERKIKALNALKMLGLEGKENHYPNQLSGGQQQRIAIARALVNGAPILLADEPTGNLDTKTSSEIMEIFKRLNEEQRITIILVTHEPDIASYSKRIIRFLDGKIISDEKVKNG